MSTLHAWHKREVCTLVPPVNHNFHVMLKRETIIIIVIIITNITIIIIIIILINLFTVP